MTTLSELEAHTRRDLRMRLLALLFVMLFLILGGGLFYRQVVEANEYRQQEHVQNHRRILLPAPRGNIYDREGRMLVANTPRFSAVIYLNELRPEFRDEYRSLARETRAAGAAFDWAEISEQARVNVVQRYLDELNRLLGRDETLDANDLDRHFNQNRLLPMTLIPDLEPEEFARIIERHPVEYPVQVMTDSSRFYPHGSTAAHTLGFVVSTYEEATEDLPGGELATFSFKGKEGRTGVEHSFDDQLQGESGAEIWVVDPSGFRYERVARKAPKIGQDLVLSLDLDLQQAAEKAMGEKIGAAAAIDVNTGEVLALVSQPDFDLNRLTPFLSFEVDEEIRERGAWLNRAVQGLYPPGSTFKLITAMAALEAGVFDPTERIDCTGVYTVANRRFRCHNRAGHGPLNLEEAIRSSCNVYFYEIGIRTGIDRISEVARLFGLDEPTGVELAAETRNMVVPDRDYKQRRDLGPWFPGDTANVSIGQGYLLVSPLQMAQFAASFARGETHTPLTLVKQDKIPRTFPIEGGEPLPIDIANYGTLLRGMALASTEGTARSVQVPGLPIASKTGTAQIRPGGQPLTLAWYIGFAPIDTPEIAVAVLVEGQEPGDNFAGGATAAPIARAVYATWFGKQVLRARDEELVDRER